MAEEKALSDRLTLEATAAEGQVKECGERRTRVERELAALTTDAESLTALERDVGEWQSLRERIAAMKALQSEYDTLREEATRIDERFYQIEKYDGEN